VSKPGVGIDLTYTRFGNYTWYDPNSASGLGSSGYISFLALGVPTVDLPKTGSANFNGFVDGLWSQDGTTRRLYGSTATLSIDFGTSQLLATLNLSGRDNPFGDFLNSPSVPLGTFSGSGSLKSGMNYFSGMFEGPTGWAGSFQGGFNGPSASEYGYVFGLEGSNGATASGVAVGKRN
jgi:hypothetical protein